MIALTVRCRACRRTLQMPIVDVVLVSDDTDRDSARAVFTCAYCDEGSSVQIGSDVADLLVAQGAEVVRVTSVTTDRLEPVAPAFTLSDLEELRVLLDRPDWFDRLTDSTGSTGSTGP